MNRTKEQLTQDLEWTRTQLAEQMKVTDKLQSKIFKLQEELEKGEAPWVQENDECKDVLESLADLLEARAGSIQALTSEELTTLREARRLAGTVVEVNPNLKAWDIK